MNSRNWIIATVAAVVIALTVGYSAGRQSHQNVNDLISVGFTVIDPEGRECERWDDGLLSLAGDYWTTAP